MTSFLFLAIPHSLLLSSCWMSYATSFQMAFQPEPLLTKVSFCRLWGNPSPESRLPPPPTASRHGQCFAECCHHATLSPGSCPLQVAVVSPLWERSNIWTDPTVWASYIVSSMVYGMPPFYLRIPAASALGSSLEDQHVFHLLLQTYTE